jgi:hypothetical protein
MSKTTNQPLWTEAFGRVDDDSERRPRFSVKRCSVPPALYPTSPPLEGTEHAADRRPLCSATLGTERGRGPLPSVGTTLPLRAAYAPSGAAEVSTILS